MRVSLGHFSVSLGSVCFPLRCTVRTGGLYHRARTGEAGSAEHSMGALLAAHFRHPQPPASSLAGGEPSRAGQWACQLLRYSPLLLPFSPQVRAGFFNSCNIRDLFLWNGVIIRRPLIFWYSQGISAGHRIELYSFCM